jgi:hypothetical protein
MKPGQVLEVLTTDPDARRNFSTAPGALSTVHPPWLKENRIEIPRGVNRKQNRS